VKRKVLLSDVGLGGVALHSRQVWVRYFLELWSIVPAYHRGGYGFAAVLDALATCSVLMSLVANNTHSVPERSVSQRSIRYSQPQTRPSQSDIPILNGHSTSTPTTPHTAVLPQPCYAQPTSPKLHDQSCVCRVPGQRHRNTMVVSFQHSHPVASHTQGVVLRGKRPFSSHNNKSSIIVPPSECCTLPCMKSAPRSAQSRAG
jgi:hypothetical protein